MSECPPFPSSQVQLLLKAHSATFRSGDAQAYSTSRAHLRRGISKAEYCDRVKVEEHFSNCDP